MGIENNDFTHNEREIGYFKTPEMCIAAVREQCPNAAIANYHKDALDMYCNNESVFGECWCQAFDMHDITLEPRHNDGWMACLLDEHTDRTGSEDNGSGDGNAMHAGKQPAEHHGAVYDTAECTWIENNDFTHNERE